MKFSHFLPDFFLVIGFSAFCFGCYLIAPHAAFIAGGILLMVAGYRAA